MKSKTNKWLCVITQNGIECFNEEFKSIDDIAEELELSKNIIFIFTLFIIYYIKMNFGEQIRKIKPLDAGRNKRNTKFKRIGNLIKKSVEISI